MSKEIVREHINTTSVMPCHVRSCFFLHVIYFFSNALGIFSYFYFFYLFEYSISEVLKVEHLMLIAISFEIFFNPTLSISINTKSKRYRHKTSWSGQNGRSMKKKWSKLNLNIYTVSVQSGPNKFLIYAIPTRRQHESKWVKSSSWT